MQNFIVSIIVKVLTNPDVQAALEKLFGGLIVKYVLPTVPVTVGAAVKSAVDEVIDHIPGVEAVVDEAKATEAAAGSIVGMFPILGNIPVLGDVLKGLGG